MSEAKQTVVERQTAKGLLKIEVTSDHLIVSVDGVEKARPCMASRLREVAGNYTHCLTVAGTTYGLTGEEIAAIETAKAAMASKPDALVSERTALVDALNAAHEIESARRDAAWEAEDEASAMTRDASAIAKAQAALDAFDAAHPEIIAQIKRERIERTAQHMWD